MYSYGVVEAALARIHNIDDKTLGAFRARIKNYQKLGLVPSSPGKGKRIQYDIEHVYIWAICLELAQFGLDPTVIKGVIHWCRKDILAAFNERHEACRHRSKDNEDIYFVFFPNMVSDWHRDGDKTFGKFAHAILPEHMVCGEIIGTGRLRRPGKYEGGRAALFNLSEMKSYLTLALEGRDRLIDEIISTAPAPADG